MNTNCLVNTKGLIYTYQEKHLAGIRLAENINVNCVKKDATTYYLFIDGVTTNNSNPMKEEDKLLLILESCEGDEYFFVGHITSSDPDNIDAANVNFTATFSILEDMSSYYLNYSSSPQTNS